MKTYPVADRIPYAELEALGATAIPRMNVRAVATTISRPPRKGEWYLSGAIVEAYRAPNDLTGSFRIAQLVVCERREEWIVKTPAVAK